MFEEWAEPVELEVQGARHPENQGGGRGRVAR